MPLSVILLLRICRGGLICRESPGATMAFVPPLDALVRKIILAFRPKCRASQAPHLFSARTRSYFAGASASATITETGTPPFHLSRRDRICPRTDNSRKMWSSAGGNASCRLSTPADVQRENHTILRLQNIEMLFAAGVVRGSPLMRPFSSLFRQGEKVTLVQGGAPARGRGREPAKVERGLILRARLRRQQYSIPSSSAKGLPSRR